MEVSSREKGPRIGAKRDKETCANLAAERLGSRYECNALRRRAYYQALALVSTARSERSA
jgi:hypothetical protein